MVTGCDSLGMKNRAVGWRVDISAVLHVASWIIKFQASYRNFYWCSQRFRPEAGTKPSLGYCIILLKIGFRCRRKAANSSARRVAIHSDNASLYSTETVSFIRNYVTLETCVNDGQCLRMTHE
jgi:hypothetical protein